MWMVIHMAKSLSFAESIERVLANEGFLVKLHPVYRKANDEENYFELLVPEAEAAEACQVLLDRGIC